MCFCYFPYLSRWQKIINAFLCFRSGAVVLTTTGLIMPFFLQHLLSICPNCAVFGFCLLYFSPVCVALHCDEMLMCAIFCTNAFLCWFAIKFISVYGFSLSIETSANFFVFFLYRLSLLFQPFPFLRRFCFDHFSLVFKSFLFHFPFSRAHPLPNRFLPLRNRSHFVQYFPELMLLFYFKKIAFPFHLFFSSHTLIRIPFFSFSARFGLEAPQILQWENRCFGLFILQTLRTQFNWYVLLFWRKIEVFLSLPCLFTTFGSLLFDSLCDSFKHSNL